MTDKLTPDERAIFDRVNSGKPEPGDLARLLYIVNRLAPKPEPERLWVNVWRGPSGMAITNTHRSKAEADRDRDAPSGFAYLGRVVINLDGSQPTWEGPDA